MSVLAKTMQTCRQMLVKEYEFVFLRIVGPLENKAVGIGDWKIEKKVETNIEKNAKKNAKKNTKNNVKKNAKKNTKKNAKKKQHAKKHEKIVVKRSKQQQDYMKSLLKKHIS